MFLRVITPAKIVLEKHIESLTVPGSEGELTILPKHENLLTMLKEGIVTVKDPKEEQYIAIGGGYLETDGQNVQLLVSRAYQQDEIDEEITKKALEEAKRAVDEAGDKKQLDQAFSQLRRSQIDMKLLRKVRRKRPS